MASWSRQRKSIYALAVIIILVAAVGVPGFFYFYKAPSCFDGVKDGNELGIDCGGSCQKLCPDAFLPAAVSWTHFEEVAPGLYNVAAYVVNPNPDAGAADVPYTMDLYDQTGMLIIEVSGTMTIPPHRDSLAFQASVDVGKSVPAQATFDFTAAPDWVSAADMLAPLQVTNKDYTENASGSSLQVSLANNSALPLGPLTVYAVLYDANQNEIGFSKTIVDAIPPQGTAVAPFTWPEDRHGAVVSIEVLPVAE